MKFIVIPLIFICTIAEAAIIGDSVTLVKNSGIFFEADSVIAYNTSSPPKALPCTSIVISDLFFRTIRQGTCTWYCEYYQIGMAKPFYCSKRPAKDFDFTNLNLNDTSQFTKLDTVRSSIAGCVLPSNETFYLDLFFIGKTGQGKFVFFTIRPIQRQGSDESSGIPRIYYYFTEIKITWYIQTNGNPEFPGIVTNIIQPSNRTLPKKNSKMSNGRDGMYTITGQRLTPYKKQVNNGQIIISNGTCVFQGLK